MHYRALLPKTFDDRLAMYGLLAVLSVLFFRLFDSFNLDETGLLFVLNQSPSAAFRDFTTTCPMLSAFEIIMWPWTKLVGSNEFLFRLPSFLFFVVYLAVVFDIGRTHFSGASGLIFVLIASSIPQVQAFGATARPYSLALLTSALSLRGVFSWSRKPSVFSAFHAGAWLAMACLTRVFSVEILPVVFVYMFWRMRREKYSLSNSAKNIAAFASLPAAAILLQIPLILHFKSQTAFHSFAGERSLELAYHLMLKPVFPPDIVLPVVAMVLILRFSIKEQANAIFCLALALAPIGVNFFLTVVADDFLISEKYVNASYVPATILCSALASCSMVKAGRRSRWLKSGFLIWISIVGTLSAITLPSENEDWRRAFNIVRAMDGIRAEKLLLVPGFFENQHMDLINLPSLKAPAAAYGIASPIIVVPKVKSDSATKWVFDMIEREGLRIERRPILMVGKSPYGQTAISVAEMAGKRITGISFSNIDVFMLY
ncbi:MAG: hypothetical protein RIQ81_1678 [Pseudomonadota bacterium]|jgi:hypothetical protein